MWCDVFSYEFIIIYDIDVIVVVVIIILIIIIISNRQIAELSHLNFKKNLCSKYR